MTHSVECVQNALELITARLHGLVGRDQQVFVNLGRPSRHDDDGVVGVKLCLIVRNDETKECWW